MRNHVIFKFLAIALCALCLMGAIVSGGSLVVLDRETERYYYDVKVPYEIARLEDPESPVYRTIVSVLNHSLNLLDLRIHTAGADWT